MKNQKIKGWRVKAYTSVDRKHCFSACVVIAESRELARKKAINKDVVSDSDHWTADAGHVMSVSVVSSEIFNKIMLEKACECYLNRQSRDAHPGGKTDNGGRWYPSDEERCECCNSVRSPSRIYPWSYMTHCRTTIHVANLFGINPKNLRRYVFEKHKAQRI